MGDRAREPEMFWGAGGGKDTPPALGPREPTGVHPGGSGQLSPWSVCTWLYKARAGGQSWGAGGWGPGDVCVAAEAGGVWGPPCDPVPESRVQGAGGLLERGLWLTLAMMSRHSGTTWPVHCQMPREPGSCCTPPLAFQKRVAPGHCGGWCKEPPCLPPRVHTTQLLSLLRSPESGLTPARPLFLHRPHPPHLWPRGRAATACSPVPLLLAPSP